MRHHFQVIAACSAALFVPLLIPLVTGRVFTLDDLGAYHVPMRSIYSAALHGSGSMLWTPAVFAGYYLFGEGQIGMAHPWHLLLYRFLPLAAAFNLEIISSYVVMFAGTVQLLKRLRLSVAASWFGAMVFTFCGYNVFHLIHVNIVAAVAHVPWILLLVELLVSATNRRSRAQSFIGLALVVASQILVGHSQQVWFTLLLAGSLSGYFLWINIPIARVVPVPLAFALGALVAGVQLFPLLAIVSSSQRPDWTTAFSLTYSLVPSNIVQLWSPFFFATGVRTIGLERAAIHEFIVYNGAFCTLALAWIVIRWRDLPRKHLAGGLLILGTVALILAFGRYGGLYTSLLAIPGLRWFRAPTRHLMLLHLSLSILAALVFDDVLELLRRREAIEWRRLWPLAIPGVLALATMIVAGLLMSFGSREPLSNIRTILPWVALFVLMALLFAAAARGAAWAPLLLIVIAAADQGYWGFQYIFGNPRRPLMTIAELANSLPAPESAQAGDLVDTRLNAEAGPNNLILDDFRVWHGYVGLPPVLRLPDTDMAAALAGAKWRATRTGFVQIDPLDRARLLTNVRVSSDITTDMTTLDPRNEAIVEQPIGPLSGPPGSIKVLEDQPGQIVVEATTPGRQLLVFTERYDDGWQADSVEPLRVYGDFLGSVVDAGTHRITFRFNPRSFQYGLRATALGLLIVLGLLPFAFIRTSVATNGTP